MSETPIPSAPPVPAAEPEAQEPIVGRCEFRGSAPAAPPVFSVEPKALESQEPAVWHFDLRGSAAAEPKSALDAPEPVVWRFAFRGDAYEFFNIWLANTLLTIATVGLFSPWAKVRTLRYFYGSAFLNGANFDYHASPWSILAARLVVLLAPAAAAALFFSERPLEDAAFTGVIFLLLPWAIVRGFAFNARYTSHRGARFAFKKRTALAYLLLSPVVVLVALLGFFASLAIKDRRVFVDQLSDSGELIILALVLCAIILALGLRIMRGWHRFKAGNHSLGQMQFHFEKPHVGAYFLALWGIPLLGLALLLVVMLFLALFSSFAEASGLTISAIAVFCVFLVALLVVARVRASLLHVFWHHVSFSIGGEFGRLRANFSAAKFGERILLVNYLAVFLSLGLLYPWTQIRRARFLAENLSLEATPAALKKIPALRGEKESALGGEFDSAEGFDFDVGLV